MIETGATEARRARLQAMSSPSELRTDRLILRRWRDADRAPFAAINADPVVMEHFPAMLSEIESDAFVDRIIEQFDRDGWGLWAVEVADVSPFIGYVGLAPAAFDAHFTPAVEVGWRLRPDHWGKGYATEAARAAITDGFARLDVDEIVSFTSTLNLPSQAVMRRLGMQHDPADDFEHPNLPDGHRLRTHVLYRLPRENWPT